MRNGLLTKPQAAKRVGRTIRTIEIWAERFKWRKHWPDGVVMYRSADVDRAAKQRRKP